MRKYWKKSNVDDCNSCCPCSCSVSIPRLLLSLSLFPHFLPPHPVATYPLACCCTLPNGISQAQASNSFSSFTFNHFHQKEKCHVLRLLVSQCMPENWTKPLISPFYQHSPWPPCSTFSRLFPLMHFLVPLFLSPSVPFADSHTGCWIVTWQDYELVKLFLANHFQS